MEFNVCPEKHPLPIWWTICLFCDYSVGIEILRVRKGEMYGQEKDEKAKV